MYPNLENLHLRDMDNTLKRTFRKSVGIIDIEEVKLPLGSNNYEL